MLSGQDDIETGCFTGQCLYKTPLRDSQKTNELIGSLKGNPVKSWSDAINQASNAHRLVPKVKSISWDIAITEEGACIIEGNENWDIVMFQAFEPLEVYLDSKLS
ncbi:sugar-transfer associated ATP-grasp domain-containing protein [Vibrio kanaloae]|uniref:sugar-transfer associated ATP-grasp domain-containing protein n=1 Tax=Vibrio kanaloae TaxID=170673 RepID=UPI001F110C2A|nr:sugar-transfer associated ATP-grasp domain-containing protein [Vibrio kanaloae]